MPEAEAEYYEAAQWYESQQSGVGDEFLDELSVAIDKIRHDPHQFSKLETSYQPSRDLRRCLLHRFPFLVVYEIATGEIRVVAVSHARRHPNYWTDRL